MNPALLAVGATVLALAAVLAVLRPRVALVTLTALDVSGINAVLADHVGTSPYKPELGLAVLALAVLAARRRLRFAWSPVLLGLLVLTAGFCLSFVYAAAPTVSTALLSERMRDLAYFVVVYALVLSTRSVTTVARAAVLVLAGLAGLTVVHEFVLHNVGDLGGLSQVPLVQEGGAFTARHAGTSTDVNFWGRLLILLTPLAASLAAAATTWRGRAFWSAAAASLIVGVYLTQSRGGFIALLVAVVVWLALAGGRYRRSILLIPVALAVLVPLSGIGSRLLTLAAGSTATADPSVVTRKRLQLDALRMFTDSPLVGHGIGSYRTLFPRYDRVSNAYDPVTIIVAAHNFYLEQAADGGVVLLMAWAVLAGTVLFVALRTLSVTQGLAATTERFLAVGIIAGVLGWAVASVFLHLSDFRALLLLAALGAALDASTRARALPRPVPARAAPPSRPQLALAGAAVAVVGTAALAVVLVPGPTRFVNTATMAVGPAATAANGSTAYQVDVISRGRIVPTLTSVLSHTLTTTRLAGAVPAGRPASVSVSQSRLGGSIVLTVSAGSAAEAVDLGAAAVRVSESEVDALSSPYTLTGSMSGPAAERTFSPWTAVPPAAVALVSALLLRLQGRRGRSAAAPRRAAQPTGSR